jgi:hypothetical protein
MRCQRQKDPPEYGDSVIRLDINIGIDILDRDVSGLILEVWR